MRDRYYLALNVVSGTLFSKNKMGVIVFWHPLNVLDQPRGRADTEYQNTLSQRIQSARVARLVRSRQILYPIHDSAGCEADRFVDIQ